MRNASHNSDMPDRMCGSQCVSLNTMDNIHDAKTEKYSGVTKRHTQQIQDYKCVGQRLEEEKQEREPLSRA